MFAFASKSDQPGIVKQSILRTYDAATTVSSYTRPRLGP